MDGTSATDGRTTMRNSRGKAMRVPAVCMTCSRCRSKKAKCDGCRPACASCTAIGHPCTYPADQRLAKRPTPAQINSLREELAQARRVLHDAASERDGDKSQRQPSLEVPSQSHTTTGSPVDDTYIVGGIGEDGSVEVHGVSSYLRNLHIDDRESRRSSNARHSSPEAVEAKINAIRDHLFANAAFQRQRESALLYGCASFGPQIDLDGVPPELAVHLLELHWNRSHFGYLMVYRPAFFDSLANGGPYANKLLLNQIYFSMCCMDSDRDAGIEPKKRGERFYKRFKELLMDEIDRPSLPTIVAIVGVGTTLVSIGQQNAGWVLCGLAYRMIIDMGLHLDPSCHDTVGPGRLSAVESEMRLRVFWAAFLIDNNSALYLGRPPTLRISDIRVRKDMHDWYEELEEWSPYVDPLEPMTPQNALLSAYTPRPVYAISSFTSFIEIAENTPFVAAFYSVSCFKPTAEHHQAERRRLRKQLDTWKANIPPHLDFTPLVDPTPPPNQFLPHALYHVLRILLERPFLSNGHLSTIGDAKDREEGWTRCIESAFQIKLLLEAYGRAFTFRRTQYMLSYATYCAIVVLLDEAQPLEAQYEDCIKFFWCALHKIQRGTFFGLRKPLKILHSLMQRMGQPVPDVALQGSQPPFVDPMLEASDVAYDVAQPMQAWRYPEGPELDAFLQQDTRFENYAYDWDHGQNGIVNDSLIGLMDPSQPVMHYTV